jgi:HK97 family phage portal protein
MYRRLTTSVAKAYDTFARNFWRAPPGISLGDPAVNSLFGTGDVGVSGVTVGSPEDAYVISPYFSAVHLLSRSIAMMPFYMVNPKSEEPPLLEHPINRMLSNPNPNMTAFNFYSFIIIDAIDRGNFYCYIDKEHNHLWRLAPWCVTPSYTDKGMRKFTHKDPVSQVETEYTEEEIIHIPGYGFDGLQAYSLIDYAAASLGYTKALEIFGAGFYGNNSIPGGVITHPGELTPQARKRLEVEMEERLRGAYRSRRIAVLDEGMTYNSTMVQPESAQYQLTRSFQVMEMCRWIRVPPHMLYELQKTTFANNEQQGIDFLTYSLQPWLACHSQEFRRKLLVGREYAGYELAYDISPLTKMDTPTRLEAYSKGRNMGLYTLNDLLRMERRPLIDPSIGDNRIAPSTMKIMGDADPSTPIPPESIKSVIDLISSLTQLTKDNTLAIINASLPTASDELVNSLVQIIEKKGLIRE